MKYWIGPELILYDNGGNGNLQQLAEIYSQLYELENIPIKIIGNGTNIGLNAALNRCAETASREWYYLPHCDMSLLPGWD